MELRGKVYKVKDNYIAVKCEMTGFKVGDIVAVRDMAKRSLRVNRYYFAFLNWCVNRGGGDLLSQGCLCSAELHEDLKAYLLNGETTTGMNDREFSEYVDKCKDHIAREYNIDTSVFEEIYQSLQPQAA